MTPEFAPYQLDTERKHGSVRYWARTNEQRVVVPGTSTQVLGWNSDGTPAAKSLDNTYLANRTRVIPLELGSAILQAGTGARSFSSGMRISFPDAETCAWQWRIATLPTDTVTAVGVFYWLWETPATTGNARFTVILGTSGDGVVSNNSNILSDTANYACDGTTNVQQLSNVTTTGNLDNGRKSLAVNLQRIGGDAADTINDVVYLRGCWLEYTADS